MDSKQPPHSHPRGPLDFPELGWLSHRFGPFIGIQGLRALNDYDYLHAVTASVRDVGDDEDFVAAGGSFSFKRARAAAFGEALERHALHSHQYFSFIEAPFEENGTYVDPMRLLHYPQSFYASPTCSLHCHKPNDPIFWLEGWRLKDGQPIRVPALAVFPASKAHWREESPLNALTSTGAACGIDMNRAVMAGLYEVIERDAFTIHWENRWPGAIAPLPASCRALAARITRRGFNLHLRRLESDTGIPVAVAGIEDMVGGRAALGIGLGTRATWKEAAFRAIEEAALTSYWVTNRKRLEPDTIASLLAEMEGLPTPARHGFLYGFSEMPEGASFLWQEGEEGTSSAPPDSFGDAAAELEWLVDAVSEVSGDPVAVDITTPFAARIGLRIVKVIVPEFVPLPRGVQARPLENPRLVTVPTRFGVPSRHAVGFNKTPHPLP